jgi:hypothetical protein
MKFRRAEMQVEGMMGFAQLCGSHCNKMTMGADHMNEPMDAIYGILHHRENGTFL